MHALASLPSTPIVASSSWLITPNVGLMVWILVVFAISLYILKKVVFPRITAALDERRVGIEESIDSAARTRAEAEKILAEYRERLKEARAQSEEIIQRARQTAESHEHEARERSQEILAEAAKRAERDIDAATKRRDDAQPCDGDAAVHVRARTRAHASAATCSCAARSPSM